MEIVNQDDVFYRKTRSEPIVINKYFEHKDTLREEFKKMLYTSYAPKDALDNTPACECGKTTKRRNIGMRCPHCNTTVQSRSTQDLESIVWLQQPEGVAPLINPKIWILLSEKFKRGNFNVIQWLCDTTYQPPAKAPKIMPQLQALQLPRGYNNFVKKFDEIISKLLTIKEFRTKKRGIKGPMEPLQPIQELLYRHKNDIFTKYLSIPNRAVFVLENTDMSSYVDAITPAAVDAIVALIGLDDPLYNYKPHVKENRVVKAIAQLANYYQDFDRNIFSGKPGVARKHLVATRSHWSFRSVISSLTEDHRYNEIHIPWGIGVGCFRTFLANKLKNMGFSPNQMFRLMAQYARRPHPLLERLFKELIDESPYIGIPTLFQRNPSLERGSMQRMFITKVKSDPADPTISLSILTVRAFNADFDGDEMNGMLLLDHELTEAFERLAPACSAMDQTVPYKISSNLSKSKPWTSTTAAYFEYMRLQPPDPVKLAKMALLPPA